MNLKALLKPRPFTVLLSNTTYTGLTPQQCSEKNLSAQEGCQWHINSGLRNSHGLSLGSRLRVRLQKCSGEARNKRLFQEVQLYLFLFNFIYFVNIEILLISWTLHSPRHLNRRNTDPTLSNDQVNTTKKPYHS